MTNLADCSGRDRRCGPLPCGIDGRLREQAFDDLLAWMENGITPRGDDLSGDLGRLGR